jgi:hypothetical protein
MGSFSLALAGFWPGALRATDEAQPVLAQVERPALAADGCRISVLMDESRPAEADAGGLAYAPGDKPVFRVVAVNTTGEAKTIQCELVMLATKPVSPFSRMMPTPSSIWKTKLNIALSPNETKTIAVEPDIALPAGSITVQASPGERPIVALSFATAKADDMQLRNLNRREGVQAAVVQLRAEVQR